MKRSVDLWRALFRIAVGFYWLFFASQKWTGVGWMRRLIEAAPASNPIPGLHEFLALVVAPNWYLFAIVQTVGETVVGVFLILGLATRRAAILGLLLSLNLALVVAFEVGDPGGRWLYYLAVLVNAELVVVDAGWPALERLRFVPSWLR
jgi:uncharacterized membrane protein YphA (DoxX/SURF4 family)